MKRKFGGSNRGHAGEHSPRFRERPGIPNRGDESLRDVEVIAAMSCLILKRSWGLACILDHDDFAS